MRPILLCLFAISLLSCQKEKTKPTCQAATATCNIASSSIDSSRLDRKVLVIGIDGLRSEAMQESVSPAMFQFSLSGDSYFSGKNKVEDYTMSGPNWSSLCTGVHWCKHKVTENDFNDHDLGNYPHFFSYIEHLTTASIVNWTPINEFLARGFADFAPEDELDDQAVYDSAASLLVDQSPLAPDVLFLHFDELDAAGHRYGFGSHVLEYASVLSGIDVHVANLLDIINGKRQSGEQWLVAIISDHGGDGTGHGGGQENDFINQTILFLNSPEVSFKKDYVSSQVDLVPTILDYLGISNTQFDCRTDGISLIDQ